MYLFWQEFFYVLTGLIFFLFVLELSWQGVVLSRFNMNYLVLLWFFVWLSFLLQNFRIQNKK